MAPRPAVWEDRLPNPILLALSLPWDKRLEALCAIADGRWLRTVTFDDGASQQVAGTTDKEVVQAMELLAEYGELLPADYVRMPADASPSEVRAAASALRFAIGGRSLGN